MEPTQPLDAGMLTGRQQAFAMIASKCTYAQAVCLKEIHDTRAYEHFGLSWENFCPEHFGISRVHAERIIQRLEEFGETYFRLCAIVRISPDTFREIRDRLTAETIELNGEHIPLTSDNAARIRAGIRKLQDEVRRLNNHYRVPTRVTEYGIRADDVLTAVTARARLGRALPHDEAAAIRSLARHSITKWTEIEEMLAAPVNSDS